MATFAYSDNSSKDTFQNPEQAYKTMKVWNFVNLGEFYEIQQQRAAQVRPEDPPWIERRYEGVLLLEDGALLMCGTTGELITSLGSLERSYLNNIYCVKGVDWLCIHYVRIGNLTRTATRSLISIAPLRKWWNTDFWDAGKAQGWRRLYPEPIDDGISTDDLITKVVPLGKGKAAWLHMADSWW